MKPLQLLLLAPVLASLAACAPAVSPVEASAKGVGAILQPGQTWVVNGVRPDGRSETFSLTLDEPRRTPDGRVAYPQQGAKAEMPVTQADLIGFLYSPADGLSQDILSASWLRNDTDGKILSRCFLLSPGRAQDKTNLPGKYLSLNLSVRPASQPQDLGNCTMTLQP